MIEIRGGFVRCLKPLTEHGPILTQPDEEVAHRGKVRLLVRHQSDREDMLIRRDFEEELHRMLKICDTVC